MLDKIIRDAPDDMTAQSTCTKLLNKMLSERKYSAQETHHLLLGVPLFRSSRSFSSLSLSNKGALRQIQDEREAAANAEMPADADTNRSGRVVTSKSDLDRYCERPPEMEDLSLNTVLREYRWEKKKYVRRRDHDNLPILRVWPRLPPNPEGETFEEWCRSKLTLHHPFRNPDNDLLGMYDSWSEAFLARLGPPRVLPPDTLWNDWTPEPDSKDEEDDDEEIDAEDETMQATDWQVLAQLHPGHQLPDDTDELGSRHVDNLLNTQDGWNRWENHQRDDMGQYLTTQQREYHRDDAPLEDARVELNNLVPAQRQIHDRYQDAFQQILDGNPNPAFAFNIDGTAGTGKTFLIKAIRQTLGDMARAANRSHPLRVLAPSGVAAFNVEGWTIHSALSIPVRVNNKDEGMLALKNEKLKKIQEDWEGIEFVIIDEKSMLGLALLAQIDSRLRQLRPMDTWLGGFSVALIGDFYQLPPVGDIGLFSPAPSLTKESPRSNLQRHGKSVYHRFNTSFELTQLLRQQGGGDTGDRFRELLTSARNGELSRPQWEFLSTRHWERLSAEDQDRLKDSVCLFTRKDPAHAYNLHRLALSGKPCARIKAVHEGGREAARASSEVASNLDAELLLSIGAKVMITRNLWTEMGESIKSYL